MVSTITQSKIEINPILRHIHNAECPLLMSAEVVQVHVLVKKQTINSLKRRGLYDLVLSYES